MPNTSTSRFKTKEEIKDLYASAAHLETTDRLALIEQRLDKGSRKMDLLSEEMAENTAVTREVKEILDTVKVGLKFIGVIGNAVKWVGGVVTAAAAVVGAWHLFHK